MKFTDVAVVLVIMLLAGLFVGRAVDQGFQQAQFGASCEARGGEVIAPGKVCADGDRIIDLTPRK